MIGSNARVLTHTSPTAHRAQAWPRPGGPKFLAALLNVPGVPFTLAALALAVPAIMANRIWMFGDVFWVLTVFYLALLATIVLVDKPASQGSAAGGH